MCAVYTYEGAVNQTNVIWETWGKRCDGILFASSISNLTTGHMHMPNYSPREHEYKGIYQKVRTIMAYLYDHFLEDYDFFHILGDDHRKFNRLKGITNKTYFMQRSGSVGEPIFSRPSSIITWEEGRDIQCLEEP